VNILNNVNQGPFDIKAQINRIKTQPGLVSSHNQKEKGKVRFGLAMDHANLTLLIKTSYP
jgi:hypothetical protein